MTDLPQEDVDRFQQRREREADEAERPDDEEEPEATLPEGA
jgi:hypothetical protein